MTPRPLPLLGLDSPPAAVRLGSALTAHGFRLDNEPTLERLLACVTEHRHALVLLPGTVAAAACWSPIAALRRLRATSSIPCILVAGADDTPAGRAAMLEAGADDYLHRDVSTVEAVARIRAVLRRSRPVAAARHREDAPEPAASDGARTAWRLSVEERCLLGPDGAAHRLTGAEFELLRLLTAAGGEAVDRETICRHVFRRPWRPEDRSVDDLVKRLRKKSDPMAIQTVRGIGYAMPPSYAPTGCVENCGTRPTGTFALHIQS